jgi:pimeloyl-ACP methyl ester carboxylesterase
MSSRQFARFARDASARYRVYAPDLLGVGQTPLPDGPYTLEREVSALVRMFESLPEPAFVFGHSYGGLVAMEAALRAPSRIRAMVLYEPVVVVLASRHGSDEARAQVAAIGAGMGLDTTVDFSSWIEFFIDWWNGPGFYRSLPAPTRAQYLATAPEAHRQATCVPTATVSVEALRRLEIPTLLLTGTTSPTSARESAELAADALPQGALRRFEGAGHMGPLTHAPAVNAAVLEFFDGFAHGVAR